MERLVNAETMQLIGHWNKIYPALLTRVCASSLCRIVASSNNCHWDSNMCSGFLCSPRFCDVKKGHLPYLWGLATGDKKSLVSEFTGCLIRHFFGYSYVSLLLEFISSRKQTE